MRWRLGITPACEPCPKKHPDEEDGKKPSCEDCRPPLMPENEEPAVIYLTCRNQVIVIEDHIVDINLTAVKAMMDVFGVKNQRDCVMRVVGLFHEIRGSRESQCDAKERANCEAQFGGYLDWACKECEKNGQKKE